MATHNLVGTLGEDVACMFLIRKGYRIVTRNYRRSMGEIDIVAKKGESLHIVEVKCMSVEDFSRERNQEPEDMVTASKLRKLRRVSECFNDEYVRGREAQIDLVTVLIHRHQKVARCKLYENILAD